MMMMLMMMIMIIDVDEAFGGHDYSVLGEEGSS